MLSEIIIDYISELIGAPVDAIRAVSGGDISSTYRIEGSGESYFLKLNTSPNALEMFQSERRGLEKISESKAIRTPEVIDCNSIGNEAFLLLEFIETKSPDTEDMVRLGEQLAELHQVGSASFGLDHDNFIGSLVQSNSMCDNWNDFYVRERLIRQMDLAIARRLLTESELPKREKMMTRCEDLFQGISPSLLHGDLWGGNYLISKEGIPYLIDPAIYYGHSEVDIAMSKLFGGFGTSFYNAYHEIFPKNEGFNERIQIYQLYYLLVHLNLFGPSYYSSVKRIFKTFF